MQLNENYTVMEPIFFKSDPLTSHFQNKLLKCLLYTTYNIIIYFHHTPFYVRIPLHFTLYFMA